jgi:diacylglycerol kinase (CTP)
MATVDYQTPITPIVIQKRRSSRLPRSPSVSSTSSKRSPSPIVTSLSAENPKGVKNITRKVIKRLEGLGHLEMVESNFSVPEEEELDEGSEEQVVRRAPAKKTPMNCNGVDPLDKVKKVKVDFEIPRKLFHSSIGIFTPFQSISLSYHHFPWC